MMRTGLTAGLLAFLAGAAMAQPMAQNQAPAAQEPQFQPRRAPQFTPLLERACLPVMRGGTAAQAVENAKPLAFSFLAKNATQATVQRDENFTVTFGPKSCAFSLAYADPGFFPMVESELRAYLPRHGRYWAGRIEPDGSGLRQRRYRAGGFTFILEEQVDEHSRRLNLLVVP